MNTTNRFAIALLAVLTMPGCPGDKCDRDSDCSDDGSQACVNVGIERKSTRCTDKSDCSSGQECSGVETVDGDKVSDSGTCVEYIAKCVDRERVESAKPGDSVAPGWHIGAINVNAGPIGVTIKRD